MGAFGTAATGADGVTAAEGELAALEPAALVAITVKVYAVPFVSPVTAHDSAPAVEQVKPPGDEVTL